MHLEEAKYKPRIWLLTTDVAEMLEMGSAKKDESQERSDEEDDGMFEEEQSLSSKVRPDIPSSFINEGGTVGRNRGNCGGSGGGGSFLAFFALLVDSHQYKRSY